MRFVEEEDHLLFFQVADLRQILEEFRQQPEQEGRVELRGAHQLVGSQNIDVTASLPIRLHEIGQTARRFPEEGQPALLLQFEEATLDRANARG